jgi:hypothetical protein
MNLSYETENAIFILKSSLNNLRIAIESFVSPTSMVSDNLHSNLTDQQVKSIELSFLQRTNVLYLHLKRVENELLQINNIEDLIRIQNEIQNLSDHYYLSEHVFDYYVDLLHTRSEHGMGIILKGCDKIAEVSLRQGLEKLNREIPPVVCFLDAGQGAAILSAGIYLWDYQTNPAALIKVVRSAIPFPRLTSILHECGHQAAKITGWNEELAILIYNTVVNAGYSKALAEIWSSWTSEIAADFWSLSQCNFASVVGLSEVLSTNANRMFTIVTRDPHPMGYLRVMLGIAACKYIFGNGPWIEYCKAWETLFPIKRANATSAKILLESMPLLKILCQVILSTKMNCFSGKSLQEILPWENTSPNAIKTFLNNNHNMFSVNSNLITKDPIFMLTCFRYVQMFGGKTQKWVADRMQSWLVSLSSGGNFNYARN